MHSPLSWAGKPKAAALGPMRRVCGPVLLLPVLFLAIVPGMAAYAQKVTFSTPEKTNRITDYELLGLTDQGILVRKWGDRVSLVEAYDPGSLSQKWSKPLPLDTKNTTVVKAVPFKNRLMLLFTVKEKKETALYALLTTNDMRPASDAILLDTISRKTGAGFRYFADVSMNREYVSVLRYDYAGGNIKTINCLLLNNQARKIGFGSVEVEEKMTVEKSFLDNSGRVVLAEAQLKRGILSNLPQYEKLNLLVLDPQRGNVDRIAVDTGPERLINDLAMQPDNLNKRVVIAGFYAQRADVSEGYFYTFVDLETATVSQNVFSPFGKEFMQKTKSSIGSGREAKNVSHLKVADLVVRRDGGAMLLGEAYYADTRRTMRSNLETYYSSRQYVEVTNYYYDDIVALSINPDGSLFWDEVLKKRQFSEEDGGYFSSFGLVANTHGLWLIFNEDVTYEGNMSVYSLGSGGEYKITGLPNNVQVLVAPRYAHQLNRHELLLPAFNSRDEFMLAKINFLEK